MATSVVNELVVWNDTSATEVASATGTGPVYLNAGVYHVDDPATTAFVQDDFISGNQTSGQIGGLSWLVSGTLSHRDGEANHPGIVRLDSSASGGTVVRLYSKTAANSPVIIPADTFDLTFILRINVNDSNTVMRFGLSSDLSSLTASNGIYIEKKAADTEWFGVCRSGGTETPRTSALASTDTSFHRFRIRRVDASTIGFTYDGGAEATLTTNIPTAGLVWGMQLSNNGAAESKTFDVDYASLRITGMTR